MEIHRCAARKPGAERRVVVREREPQMIWDSDGVRLVLRTEDNSSWKDDGTHFDYDVFLTPADIARITQMVAARAQHAELGATADRPRE